MGLLIHTAIEVGCVSCSYAVLAILLVVEIYSLHEGMCVKKSEYSNIKNSISYALNVACLIDSGKHGISLHSYVKSICYLKAGRCRYTAANKLNGTIVLVRSK